MVVLGGDAVGGGAERQRNLARALGRELLFHAVDDERGVGRGDCDVQELLVVIVNHQGADLVGGQLHHVGLALLDAAAQVVVVYHAEYGVLDGDGLDAVGHVQPYLGWVGCVLLLHVFDSEAADVEHELAFGGLDLYQCAFLAVLVHAECWGGVGGDVLVVGPE